MVSVGAPSFEGPGLFMTIAASLALIAGVLAAIATGVAWATFESNGAEVEYRATEFEGRFGGFGASVDYSDEGFDDSEGIGLLRAGGPLLIAGVVVVFLAFATLTASLFVRGVPLGFIGAIVTAVAAVLLVLANIMLPVGIDANASDSGLDPSWGAGLILTTIASAFTLGATALGFVAREN